MYIRAVLWDDENVKEAAQIKGPLAAQAWKNALASKAAADRMR